MHSAKRLPPAGKLLFVLHLLLALGALFGGGALMLDPGGDLLMLPLSLLDQTPFASYLLPGVILLLLFGLVPLVIMWGFLRHPSWKAAEAFNLFKRHHWSWSFSLYTGYALVIWIIVQTYLFQEVLLIHLICAGLGLLIQAVTLLPRVQAWAEEIKRT